VGGSLGLGTGDWERAETTLRHAHHLGRRSLEGRWKDRSRTSQEIKRRGGNEPSSGRGRDWRQLHGQPSCVFSHETFIGQDKKGAVVRSPRFDGPAKPLPGGNFAGTNPIKDACTLRKP